MTKKARLEPAYKPGTPKKATLKPAWRASFPVLSLPTYVPGTLQAYGWRGRVTST